ncbi:MAG TPA: M15 family metallopeptidase [Egicoccus sp.]|nr:M15 family metallopeptidase [Egicoccus sp.]HSK23870.1 M15 family metallopeptidase [Egicoccus sp.]
MSTASQHRHRPWSVVAVAAAATLALSGCSAEPGDAGAQATGDVTVRAGGSDEVVAAPVPDVTVPGIPSLEPSADVGVSTPYGVGADDTAASAATSAEDLPEEVALVQPRVLVRDDEPLAPDAIERVAAEEALHTAAVTDFTVDATSPAGASDELQAMRVDVEDFRRFTPDVTAQNVGVWQRLADGDVVVRHDVAHELELELGGTVTLRTETGSVPARIGAFAANGAPPFADVLVPAGIGDELGAGAANALIVGHEGADGGPEPEDLADRLGDELAAEAEVIRPPAPQQAKVKQAGRVSLEPFTYTSRGDGTIAIHGDWVAQNIVPVDIPGMGTTRCHKVMVPQLRAALREVAEAGLYDHLDPGQFAGCFVARHILWNPSRALSMHAWGLAIDFNARDNGYGVIPKMDLRIVEIFEKWGFSWGGWWSVPDGMHFELERVVEVG